MIGHLSGRNSLTWLCAAVANAISIVSILHSVYFAWMYMSTMPFWDFWNWLSDYQNFVEGRYHISDLINLHNEHRIATTRLVLFVDAIWFHMTGGFVLVCNFTLLFMLGIAVSIISRTGRPSKHGSVTPVLVSIALAMSVCQWPNLVEPFQIQFAWLCVSIVVSAALAAKAASPSTASAHAAMLAFGAGLCVFAATFSMAAGLLSIPWIILLLIVRRAASWPFAIFVGIAVFAAALFLYHYSVSASTTQFPKLRYDFAVLVMTFAAGFLGSAFYPYWQIPFIVGFAGLLTLVGVSAFGCYMLIGRRSFLAGRTLALWAVCGTIACMSGAAALSRLSAGMSASLEPRYGALSLLFWACLLPLVAQIANDGSGEWVGWWFERSRVMIVLPVVMLIACNFNPGYDAAAARLNSNLESQAESVRQNVYVAPLFAAAFYGGVKEAEDRFRFIRKYKLAVFAPGVETPPPPLSRTLPIGLPACSGRMDTPIRLDESRVLVRGWLGSPHVSKIADWLALADKTGAVHTVIPATEILGKTRIGRRKVDGARGFYSGVVFTRGDDNDEVQLSAFGIFDGSPDATCRWPVTLRATALRLESLSSVTGNRILDNTVQGVPEGAFRLNGVTTMAPIKAPFPGEAMYASGAAGDAETGMVSFIVTPHNKDIVVPFATGPSVVGQTIQATFHDGATLSMAMPTDSQDGLWRAVVIPYGVVVKHGGGPVRISGMDDGEGWGQWLAVATPIMTEPHSGESALY